MRLGTGKIIAIFICPLLAIGLGDRMISSLFVQLPSDFARTSFILNTLQETPEPSPGIILLGNSILMNGVDAKILGENIGQECWNLSSPGQSLVEGSLYLQDLPEGVRDVVQFVSRRDFQRIGKPQDKVLRNFYLYGYRPSEETFALLSDSVLQYFQQSGWAIRFEGRGILINSLNRALRGGLREDLALDALNTDKYFPNPYTKRVSEAQYQKLIKRFNPSPQDAFTRISEAPIHLFQKIEASLAERNIRYHLVVYPINPDLSNMTTAARDSLSRQLEELPEDFPPTLNYVNALTPEDFVDHWHPSQSGADKLTQRLTEYFHPLPHAVSFN